MDPAHNVFFTPAMTRTGHAPLFVFAAPRPPAAFTFAFPPAPAGSLKRARPCGLSDPDAHPVSKKRRLRLHLVTSRLSLPFAVPTASSGMRPPRRCVAVALARRARGGSVLRKAAILNKIKRDAAARRIEHDKRVEAARREFRERLAAAAHSSFQRSSVVRRPRRRRRPPSPPRSPSPPAAGEEPCITTAYPQPLLAHFFDDGSSAKDVDPYAEIPNYYRPPSPPSEAELDRQRRGMGLDIGLC